MTSTVAVVVDDFIPYTRSGAPASTLFSTLDDMTRFALANLNHGELDSAQVLRDAGYADMWAPHAASPFGEILGPPASHYGLGWWVGELDGHPLVGGYGAFRLSDTSSHLPGGRHRRRHDGQRL